MLESNKGQVPQSSETGLDLAYYSLYGFGSQHRGYVGDGKMNVNILGISELIQTAMGEFNLDDHYIYYCGQESLRRNGAAIIVNTKSKMQYLNEVWKMTEWSLFISKANHSVSW